MYIHTVYVYLLGSCIVFHSTESVWEIESIEARFSTSRPLMLRRSTQHGLPRYYARGNMASQVVISSFTISLHFVASYLFSIIIRVRIFLIFDH